MRETLYRIILEYEGLTLKLFFIDGWLPLLDGNDFSLTIKITLKHTKNPVAKNGLNVIEAVCI